MNARFSCFRRFLRAVLCGAVLPAFFQPAFALFDLNENGMGDFWELYYGAGDLEPDGDEDGDGNRNEFESLIGSDPFDPESYFGVNGYRFEKNNTQLVFNFQAIKGVRYYIESSPSLHPEAVWRRDHTILSNGTGSIEVEFFINSMFERTRYFRVGQETDEDQDGLTSWEESVLGLSDRDANSNGGGLSDLTWAFDRHFSGNEIVIEGGTSLPGAARSIEDVSRFLNQATFGPTYEMIEELHSSGQTYAEWIDEQMEMDPTTLEASLIAEMELGAGSNANLFRRGWWRAAVEGSDQLRQRLAFALSQILVVSGTGSDLVRGDPTAGGSYYDLLIKGGFGNYADLLEDVTYHVGMGNYLGHLRNRKADPVLGTFPDENYAREVMQLFSIGLWELNRDGSQKKDYQGRPIPTYTNFHVTELAKVMTGFNWGGTTSFIAYNPDTALPMTIWESDHDLGEKFLVNGGYLPPNQNPEKDVRDAIDNLVAHPSAAPFLSRLLIQRFVTSNPSPDYLERVSLVFENNGRGERADLSAVVRAILLDPEARGYGQRIDPAHGKMREPYITHVHLVRAFDSRNEIGNYPLWSPRDLDELGQAPLMSPSVFNFYSPNYRPSLALGRSDLTAPEFEILDPLRVVAWPNRLRATTEWGAGYLSEFPGFALQHDFLDELALVDAPEELMNRLDLMFTYGTLKPETRVLIKEAMNGQGGNLSDEKKLWMAIYLVMTSPEYVILR
jgi:uncharacterized protein (DUF1800 family)